MALRLMVPALLAGAAAAAIAFAPAAAAEDGDRDTRPDRTARGTSQQDAWNKAPKGWSNEAQWARPGAGSNPFGTLPRPPVFALD